MYNVHKTFRKHLKLLVDLIAHAPGHRKFKPNECRPFFGNLLGNYVIEVVILLVMLNINSTWKCY